MHTELSLATSCYCLALVCRGWRVLQAPLKLLLHRTKAIAAGVAKANTPGYVQVSSAETFNTLGSSVL